MWGEKKQKAKKEKIKKNRKKIGDRKVVSGTEGALMEDYRKRKIEACSVRKDVTGGSLLAG